MHICGIHVGARSRRQYSRRSLVSLVHTCMHLGLVLGRASATVQAPLARVDGICVYMNLILGRAFAGREHEAVRARRG